jgi:crotonobetainyl-CoA:carnitine CoA-transferase CaiB-like acyl-CoA transferase
VDILEGVRVVDVSMWAMVPAAGGVLAHWGADVIKVEGPGRPDPQRMLVSGSQPIFPERGQVASGPPSGLEPGGANVYFKHYSRGKRSIAVDLATEEGREVLYRLVDTADVFLTSFLPETRKKLKFDVDDIRARNPNIIYVRGTGQGPLGPQAERGGYDAATWWCRGSLAWSTMQLAGVETPVGMIGHGDGMSGMTLAGGICAALARRALTGKTSIVDGSLLATAMWFNGLAIIQSQFGPTAVAGLGPVPPSPHAERPATSNMYRTEDGRFLQLLMIGDSDADWADLVEHLGRPDLASDPRFATTAIRAEHRREAVEILDGIFASRSLGEWERLLVTTRGVWAPVRTTKELYDDPQTSANGFLGSAVYPTGSVTLPSPPILFDEQAGDPPLAPDFAQHTDEVLRGAGYSDAEITRLHDQGVVV